MLHELTLTEKRLICGSGCCGCKKGSQPFPLIEKYTASYIDECRTWCCNEQDGTTWFAFSTVPPQIDSIVGTGDCPPSPRKILVGAAIGAAIGGGAVMLGCNVQ